MLTRTHKERARNRWKHKCAQFFNGMAANYGNQMSISEKVRTMKFLFSKSRAQREEEKRKKKTMEMGESEAINK